LSSGHRRCHIVQIGSDDSVFSLSRDSEPVRRQVTYGEVLESLRPGSVMTLVVLTRKEDAIPFQVGNVVFRPLAVNLRGWSKLRAWRDLYAILDELDRKQRIDVLTTQTVYDVAWVALLFAKKRRRAIIGQIHFDIFNPYAKRGMSRYPIVRHIRYATLLAALKHFTAIRAVGEGIAREIRRRNLHDDVHVIPVPMAMLTGELACAGKQERNSKVLFVGRLAGQKNLATWLKVVELVAQRVPEAAFEIVGEGKLRKALEDLAKEKGLRDKVRFTGFVDYRRLPEIYQSASVFLITSLYEGFGRVVAEALANRVPVVAPQITGIEDIVVHGRSGFLHSPSDVTGMAGSVISLLCNPAMRDEMGRWGETFVRRKFNPETLTKKWVQLLVERAPV